MRAKLLRWLLFGHPVPACACVCIECRNEHHDDCPLECRIVEPAR